MEWAQISSLGSRDLLATTKLALFCSRRCPGAVILRTYDLVVALRGAPLTWLGGFHSPMEQECLRLALQGTGRAILCPARSIARLRPKPEWKEPLAERRLLVLSPFAASERRVTRQLAARRNAFAVSLADALLVAYAAPASATEALTLEALAAGKPVFTLNLDRSSRLVQQGARVVGSAAGVLEDENENANAIAEWVRLRVGVGTCRTRR